MRFFVFFLVIAVFSVGSAARAESHSIALHAASLATGMIDGKKAGADDYPEVLHLLGHNGGDKADPRNLDFKCSGVALGRCLLSAAHCFQGKDRKKMTVHGEGKFSANVDVESVRYFERTHDKLKGNDLALVRLDSTPPKHILPEDLAKEEDLVLPKYPEKLTKDTVKDFGLPVTVGGFGIDYDEEALKKAIEDAPPEKRAAVRLGAMFRKHRDAADPIRRYGEMRLLGSFGEVAFQKERADLAALRVLALAGKESDRKKLDEAAKLLDGMASWIVLPSPSRPLGGDSGGPVFYQSKRGRVVVGIYNAGVVDGREIGGEFARRELWRNLLELKFGLVTPVALRRQWILDQYKALGCEPARPETDAMPKGARP